MVLAFRLIVAFQKVEIRSKIGWINFTSKLEKKKKISYDIMTLRSIV